jgi:hypothetical protein
MTPATAFEVTVALIVAIVGTYYEHATIVRSRSDPQMAIAQFFIRAEARLSCAFFVVFVILMAVAFGLMAFLDDPVIFVHVTLAALCFYALSSFSAERVLRLANPMASKSHGEADP